MHARLVVLHEPSPLQAWPTAPEGTLQRLVLPQSRPKSQRSALGTCAVDGHPTAEVVAALREQGVTTSLPPATYAPLDLDARGLTDLGGAAPHYYNDIGALDRLVDLVEALC